MDDVSFIESVNERDIDLLLLEELTVSTEFQTWFINQVCDIKINQFTGVWHSIYDSRFGESDLITIFISNTNQKYGVLIENKIDAIAQKDQSKRYVLRGNKGIKNGDWDKFITCIVSPKRYIKRNIESKKYDQKITYEQIQNYFLSIHSKRSTYKAKMINEAIEQNRRGYTIDPNEQVTKFWHHYFHFVNTNYPELEMNTPGVKPANSDWPYFRPKALDQKMNIVHKLSKGVVDLQIFGMANNLDYLTKIFSEYLDDEKELVKTSKSASLRITVSPINRFLPFEEQKDKIEKALSASILLLNIGTKIKDLI